MAESVLIAASEPARSAFADAVREAGFEPLTAGDRRELLEAVRAHQPLAVVLDAAATAPAGGLALAGLVRECAPHTRVVFVGPDRDRDALQALEVGDAYCGMPPDPAVVRHVIQTAWHTRRLKNTGQYRRRRSNTQQLERSVLAEMRAKVGRAIRAHQVAEILHGYVREVIPIEAFGFCEAPLPGDAVMLPRVYVRHVLTPDEHTALRDFVAQELGDACQARSKDPTPPLQPPLMLGPKPKDDPSRAASDARAEGACAFFGLVLPLDAGDRCAGAVALVAREPLAPPPSVRALLEKLAGVASVRVAHLQGVQAERLALLRAVLESSRESTVWISRRQQQLLANTPARALLGLADGPLAMPALRERLAELGLLDALFGEAVSSRSRVLRNAPLGSGPDAPRATVSLLRVRGPDQLMLGTLLRFGAQSDQTGTDPSAAAVVATLAHDLKVPLQGVEGYATLLLEEIDGPLTEAQRSSVEALLHAAHRLDAILLYVFETTRLKVHGLTKRKLDVASLFAEAVERSALRAQQSDIRLITQVPDNASTVYADATSLSLVLDNLLANALRYSPPGGQVTLSARAPDASTPDGTLTPETPTSVAPPRGTTRLKRRFTEIVCQDEGPGVPESERTLVFTKGYRGSTAPVRGGSGSGLGLAIVREIVEAHGGQVHVEPGPSGTGAAFIVTLPAAFLGVQRASLPASTETPPPPATTPAATVPAADPPARSDP